MMKSLKEEFILKPEDDVTAFLGIEFWKLANSALELVQPYLINRVIELSLVQMNVMPKYSCLKSTSSYGFGRSRLY